LSSRSFKRGRYLGALAVKQQQNDKWLDHCTAANVSQPGAGPAVDGGSTNNIQNGPWCRWAGLTLSGKIDEAAAKLEEGVPAKS